MSARSTMASCSMRRSTLLVLFGLLAHLSDRVMVTANLTGGIIKLKDNGFVDQAGNPFLVHGANYYWLMYQAASPSSRNFVDAVLEDAQSMGLNVGRTWAFSDGGDRALQRAPGDYDENVFKGLDYAVAQAAKHNIRLVMSLVNNYDSYGGKPQYAKWARLQGQKVPNDDAFYTNALMRTWYKNHVKKVLTRVNSITGVAYMDDPAIFAWELMNEPHCETDPSGDTVAAWVKEMAAYVKSIDKKHLLEIGLEGFYGASTGGSRRWANPSSSDGAGTDFMRLNQIANIDYATVHSYPDLWIPDKTNDQKLKFLQIWVNLHIKDATQTLQKPVLFCEFGKSNRVPGYTVETRKQFFWAMYNSVYSSVTKGGSGAGTMIWQLLPSGMEAWNDGFGVFASDSPVVSIIKTQTSRLNKFKVSRSKPTRRLLL